MHRAMIIATVLLCACPYAAGAQMMFWEQDPNVPEADRGVWITDMSFRGNRGVVAMSNGHLWVTSNRGQNWGGVNLAHELDFTAVRPSACAIDGDTVIVATKTSHVPMMCYSHDGGHRWERGQIDVQDRRNVNEEWWIGAIDIDPGTRNAMAAAHHTGKVTHADGTESPHTWLKVVLTYDGGESWHELPEVAWMACQRVTGVCCRLDSVSFVCGEAGMLKWYTHGAHDWEQTDLEALEVEGTTFTDHDFECMASYGDHVWAATDTGWVIRRHRGTGRWHASRVFEPTESREREWVSVDMAMADQVTGALVGPQGIYRTVDGGETWLGPDPVRRDPDERSSAGRPTGDLAAAFTALRRDPWEALRLGFPGARDWYTRSTVRRPGLLRCHGVSIIQPAPQPRPRLPFHLPGER